MLTKQERYDRLVSERKQCRCQECRPLCNQSQICGGAYDYNQIGSWSLWHGNLDAKIVVVGRDWGSAEDWPVEGVILR